MRFTSWFAVTIAVIGALAVAGSTAAQVEPLPGPCPGGANMELTALTLPAAVPVPVVPKVPRPQPPPAPPAPKVPKKKRAAAPQRAQPPPPPQPVFVPRPRRNTTDDALNDMIGQFGSRPRSGPVIDDSQPFPQQGGIGAGLRDQAVFQDRQRFRDRPRSRPRSEPGTGTAPQSTPQSTPQQHPGDTPKPGPPTESFPHSDSVQPHTVPQGVQGGSSEPFLR